MGGIRDGGLAIGLTLSSGQNFEAQIGSDSRLFVQEGALGWLSVRCYTRKGLVTNGKAVTATSTVQQVQHRDGQPAQGILF